MNFPKTFFALFLLFFGLRSAFSQPAVIKQLDQTVIKVAQWGGTPAKDTARVHEIKFITLHHGGEEFKEDKDFATYLVNLQNWSRSEKKWIDIPYHYLIDFEGKIYEGRDIRYAGDTNTAYDPTGHALVCLPGNYEIQQPNEKQLRAIIDMFTWLCWKYKLPPEVIKGHKDVAEGTVCPGKNLYAYLENGFIKKGKNNPQHAPLSRAPKTLLRRWEKQFQTILRSPNTNGKRFDGNIDISSKTRASSILA